QPIEKLWGEFFVTGHLEPLEKIVRLLKPFTLPELAGEKLRRETAEEWAFWSLVEYGPDIP
ncbi:hypothetical protein GWN75_11900, partial [candidate division KSB1 bacterium]|nr:hypothetical protein [candidate division KSB1 bacterium]NIV69856.1 hypothetical protein [Phycisphaerae bacterium]NIS24620.1 hypothetical protein [candidate division KSB1 bacterium]NIU25220.1 hypothetical protein [candidate division KSB1 bacterium]NIU91800.1 hypothetical protein [candidate division KSB1 bacterium]